MNNGFIIIVFEYNDVIRIQFGRKNSLSSKNIARYEFRPHGITFNISVKSAIFFTGEIHYSIPFIRLLRTSCLEYLRIYEGKLLQISITEDLWGDLSSSGRSRYAIS